MQLTGCKIVLLSCVSVNCFLWQVSPGNCLSGGSNTSISDDSNNNNNNNSIINNNNNNSNANNEINNYYYDTNILSRDKRYLVYPKPASGAPTKVQLIIGLGLPMEVDVSTIVGYVVKMNYNLPYNASFFTEPYIRYERSANDEENRDTELLSRWEIYKMLETALEAFGSGKSCLLRAICETSNVPLNFHQGIFPQLLQILLMPSSTSETSGATKGQEYMAAEVLGREHPRNCLTKFPECPYGVLDYFTEVLED